MVTWLLLAWLLSVQFALGVAFGYWLGRRPRRITYATATPLWPTPAGQPIRWAPDGTPANPADYTRRMVIDEKGNILAG